MNLINAFLLTNSIPNINFSENVGFFPIILHILSLIFSLALFIYIIYTVIRLNKVLKKADSALDIYLRENGTINE